MKRYLTSCITVFLSCFLFNLAYAAQGNTTIIPEVNAKSAKNSVKKTNDHVQTTTFSREKIADSPVVTLSELFKQEQSVVRLTNNSSDASQTALSLRGFGDNAAANSLILVDGFPLTNPSLLAPNFNSIPLSDIERIEITQGSQGTLWGDQAVGGVVNIITRHPKKLFADGMLAVGSYNKNLVNVLVGDKFANGLFVKVFGLIDKTNNYRGHNQQSDDNIAAQLGKDYSRGTLSLYLQSYSDTNNFPGGLTEQQYFSNPRQATNFTNYSHYKTQVIQLLSKHAVNENWVLETRLEHHDIAGNGFVYLPYHRTDSQNNFSPRLIGSIYNNKITLGYDGQISHYKLLNTKVQSQTSAKQNNVYLQTVIPLTTMLDVTLGGRAAWQNNTIEKIIGQATTSQNHVFVTEQGMSFHPNNTWSFFLRRDGNFSFPKANEETWVPSNINALNVQTGVSYEAGAERHTDEQRSQINIYRLALHDEIAFNPTQTPLQPFGSFNNLDETLRQGITLTEFYRFTKKFALDTQLNYVNARFASGQYSGNLIPAVPAVNGNIGLNYDITSRWQAKYAVLYTGSRYASEDVANAGKKLSAYYLHDAAIQYVIKPVNISFEIVNVFNQRYPAYSYYNPDAKTLTYYPGAGRNYLLTMKINLD